MSQLPNEAVIEDTSIPTEGQQVLDLFQAPSSMYAAWQRLPDNIPDYLRLTFREYVIDEGYIEGYGLPSQQLRDRDIRNKLILLEQRRLGAPDQDVLDYFDSAEGSAMPSVDAFRHYWETKESFESNIREDKPNGDGTDCECGFTNCWDLSSPLVAVCRQCQKKVHAYCGQWVSRQEMECFTCRQIDDLPDIFTIEAHDAETPFPAEILDHRIEGVHPRNRQAEPPVLSLQGAVYRQLDMGERVYSRIVWTDADKSEVIVEPINNQLLSHLFQEGLLKAVVSKGIVDECIGRYALILLAIANSK
jgi:hypothetical protein